MKFIDINTIDSKYKQYDRIIFEKNKKKIIIMLSEQKTGYGKKKFFVCPKCQKQKVKLYFYKGEYVCNICANYNPYKSIQNGTKGGYIELGYRMKKYAYKHHISFEFPFNYLNFALEPRFKKVSFLKQLKVLQALENMRFQNIFYQTTYNPLEIRMVLNGTHPLLEKLSLRELQQYVYSFSL